jgi:hypothetical protein
MSLAIGSVVPWVGAGIPPEPGLLFWAASVGVTGPIRILVMEHRGIEYLIKIGINKQEWAWSIRTAPPKQGKVSGSRDDAVYAAVRAIEQWCHQHPDDCGPPNR